jgi:calmodulin
MDSQRNSTTTPPLTSSSVSSLSDGCIFFGAKPPSKRPISKSQMKEFRDIFKLFDKDNNGSITKDELLAVMRSLGQFALQDELQDMLDEMDLNKDGTVSFDEFVEILANINEQNPLESSADQEEKELRDAFRVFDKHNRGYITASDLRAVLQCLGEDLDEDESEYILGSINFFSYHM